MPARTQELKIGIGFAKQPNTGTPTTTKTQLQTALSAGSLWSLELDDFAVPFPEFNKENDSAFFGKSDEWIRQVFPTSINIPWQWKHFLTSQNFAQVAAFALGSVTESPSLTYTITPLDSLSEGVNLPATTIVAGVRQATGGEILDLAAIGMVCTGFSLRFQRGPGLQNSSLTSDWLGCGKHVNNSGITIPALTTETRLGSGSGTVLTINDVDYLTNARFVDLEFSYQNNLSPDSGYFLGSGQQSGFDIRGRMRMGRRTMSLIWTVELESDSTELAQLLAGTGGATTLTLDAGGGHSASLHMPSTLHKAFSMTDADGYVAARVETDILGDDSLGPLVITAVTDRTGICQ